jgi:hypothetical protein
MTFGKFMACLLIAGGMAYGGYLLDLPQMVYIGTGVLIFIVAIGTVMK